MRFSTFIPLITDDINQFSFLTWSTSRYRVLRDLPTFGHIPNKSRSLGDIGKVACSVPPSATCPLKCFVAISLKNSRAKLTCIALSFPVTTPPKVGSCVVFCTGVLLLPLLVFYNLKSKSPCCPVSSPFKCPWHFFWRWTVVLPVCNMRSKDLGGLQKWDRSSCVSLWNVAIQGWKTRSSHVKCCQTLRTEIETRSPRADRTNFGSEDIEWSCVVDIETGVGWWGLSDSICLFLYAVFNIHLPDHRWHQPVVFFDMVDVEVQGSPWFAYLWSHTK